MKKIAVITGASSGMGREFVKTLNTFDKYDEIWAIARRKDRLEELKSTAPFPVRAIPMDLTDPDLPAMYQALLDELGADERIALLVNASGFGTFEAGMSRWRRT